MFYLDLEYFIIYKLSVKANCILKVVDSPGKIMESVKTGEQISENTVPCSEGRNPLMSTSFSQFALPFNSGLFCSYFHPFSLIETQCG